MALAFLIGRILFGGYFLYNALNHFLNVGFMAQYAGSKGVPAPEVAVLGTGLLLLVGGAAILLGYAPLVGIGAIAVFLIGVTPMMHDFWNVGDPQMRMAEMVNFSKNMALLGGTLMLVAIPQPWAYAVAARRRVPA